MIGADPGSAFEQLVQKADQEARRHPLRYRIKLVLLAALGYLVMLSLVLLGLSLIVWFLATTLATSVVLTLLLKNKFLLPVVLALFFFLRSAWVRIDPPVGYVLDRHSFPALWQEVDRLQQQLDTLPIHAIVLLPDQQAAIQSTPRRGLLGPPRNTLVLGLQTLMLLPMDQARAVLAHEFGHLSKSHNRFIGWIYRLRLGWAQIQETFTERAILGSEWIQRFFKWYAPYFAAYSFTLARQQEFEADQVAAEVTGSEVLASALIRSHVYGEYLDEVYWRGFHNKVRRMAKPDYLPYQGLNQFTLQSPPRPELAARLDLAWLRDTAATDSHPALRERLQALTGASEPALLAAGQAQGERAADAWLGDQLPLLVDIFDQRWLGHNEADWRDRHDYLSLAKQRLQQLAVQPLVAMDDEPLLERARLTAEIQAPARALPLYQAFLQRQPEHSAARFEYTEHLFQAGNAQAYQEAETLLNDPTWSQWACEMAYRHALAEGDKAKQTHWLQQARRLWQALQRYREERSQVTKGDVLLPANAPDELCEALAQSLRASGKVKHAWLTRKQVQTFADHPLYVAAFQVQGFGKSYQWFWQQVAPQIEQPERVVAVVLGGRDKPVARAVKRVGESLL